MHTTPVIYRRSQAGIITAILPTIPAADDPRLCLVYTEGMYISADPEQIVAETEPAQPYEYHQIHAELASRYYGLEPRERSHYRYYDERAKLLARADYQPNLDAPVIRQLTLVIN